MKSRARFLLDVSACASLFVAALLFSGCASYVDSTPAKVLEDDHSANYSRVFKKPVPPEVTVVHSAVVTYSYRPGVVTTDDFEFELLAPESWVRATAKRFYMHQNDSGFNQAQLAARKDNARPWYAPKSLDQYDLYRDATSVGYAHMLVDKTVEADGRRRVFISKH